MNDIVPALLNGPVLEETSNKYPIEIISKGSRFSLVPVNECKINGLIVDNLNYSLMISRLCKTLEEINLLEMNKGFTIIWGSNVGNKIYKNQAIKFSEGGASWGAGAALNLNEMAGISLITKDKVMWNRIRSLSLGDQIEIRGKLVNVSADRFGRRLEYNTGLPGNHNLFLVIYVEDLRILRKANIFFNYLFWMSLFSLMALAIIRLFGPLKSNYLS